MTRASRSEFRHVLDQGFRVRVPGIRENLANWAILDEPAGAEHDDIVRDAAYQGEVMGYKDHRKAMLALEAPKQLDYHSLY